MQNCITPNWEIIKEKRRRAVVKINTRENSTRVAHTYKVGQLILIVQNEDDVTGKLHHPTEGPYKILKVYRNGTLKIGQRNDKVLSIRCIQSYVCTDKRRAQSSNSKRQ